MQERSRGGLLPQLWLPKVWSHLHRPPENKLPAITRPTWRTSAAIEFCCNLTAASACRIYHPDMSVLGNAVDSRHIALGGGVWINLPSGDQLGSYSQPLVAVICRTSP